MADTTDIIPADAAGTINELGDSLFGAAGGYGDFSAVADARLARITPERRMRFIPLRNAQDAAKAATQAALECQWNIVEAQKLRDALVAECAKQYPPQSRIEALRAVQDATRRRSR